MLGRTRTLATAASTALRSHCAGLDAEVIETVWSASANAAAFTYAACRQSPARALADLAYLAALMQDAGIAVLLRRSPELAAALRNQAGALEAGVRALDALSGSDHAAAGALVARNWKLPPDVVDAIRAHHDPRLAARLPDTPRRLAILLATGRRLRDGLTPDWVDWAGLAGTELGFDDTRLAELEGA